MTTLRASVSNVLTLSAEGSGGEAQSNLAHGSTVNIFEEADMANEH